MKDQLQEEVTLKDVFLEIGKYFRYVKTKWKWGVLIGAVIGVLFIVSAMTTPPKYKERLTFMMDENESSEIPGFDLIGSIFGGVQQNNNLGKILQLFESKKIIYNTLFDTIDVGGKREILANHYLENYTVQGLVEAYAYPGNIFYKTEWPKRLLEDPNFRFSNSNIEEFTPKENQFLRILLEKIAGQESSGIPAQLSSNMDEETGLMSIEMHSEHEILTMGALQSVFKQLSNFFIQKTTEKQKKTDLIMKTKRDSVFLELKSAEYALADFKDRNRNAVSVSGSLAGLRLDRQVRILNIMYAEVVKQVEVTDFALRNKTPIVQVIDSPRLPIVPSIASWKKDGIKGFLFGFIATLFFFGAKKLFSDIMK